MSEETIIEKDVPNMYDGLQFNIIIIWRTTYVYEDICAYVVNRVLEVYPQTF